MKGGEAKFWRNELREHFKVWGHYDRIESHSTSLGRPDLNICLSGNHNWDIELKYCDSIKKGIVLRPAQIAWLNRRKRVDGKCAVLTKIVVGPVPVYLFNTNVPYGTNIDDWIDYADHKWEGRICTVDLQEILRETKK